MMLNEFFIPTEMFQRNDMYHVIEIKLPNEVHASRELKAKIEVGLLIEM